VVQYFRGGGCVLAEYKGHLNSDFLPHGEGCLRVHLNVEASEKVSQKRLASYHGTFCDGILQGRAAVDFNSGANWVGNFESGVPQGLGKAKWDIFTFSGEYRDGLPNGLGVLQNTHTGEISLGTWKNTEKVKALLLAPSAFSKDDPPVVHMCGPADEEFTLDMSAQSQTTQPQWSQPALEALQHFRTHLVAGDRRHNELLPLCISAFKRNGGVWFDREQIRNCLFTISILVGGIGAFQKSVSNANDKTCDVKQN
jgi:hypothetical protein